ncbi:hypothetical protein V1477_002309 [Vespula maculifrons]|uniref:Uncharacterized protein n=1 Tax=Vespula maculifrons TaxID=7453 RepID=A0ABD2CXJ5_VESMC
MHRRNILRKVFSNDIKANISNGAKAVVNEILVWPFSRSCSRQLPVSFDLVYEFVCLPEHSPLFPPACLLVSTHLTHTLSTSLSLFPPPLVPSPPSALAPAALPLPPSTPSMPHVRTVLVRSFSQHNEAKDGGCWMGVDEGARHSSDWTRRCGTVEVGSTMGEIEVDGKRDGGGCNENFLILCRMSTLKIAKEIHGSRTGIVKLDEVASMTTTNTARWNATLVGLLTRIRGYFYFQTLNEMKFSQLKKIAPVKKKTKRRRGRQPPDVTKPPPPSPRAHHQTSYLLYLTEDGVFLKRLTMRDGEPPPPPLPPSSPPPPPLLLLL